MKKGFTLIELLVSVTLFIILVGIATGSFIRTLRAQRTVVALMEVNDNASLALEQMAREIRTGFNFSKLSETELQFVNADNLVTRYRLNSEAIERAAKDETAGLIGPGDYRKITADNVRVENFKINLFGQDPGDGYSPRVTVSLSVGATGQYLDFVLTNIQTTISTRQIDT